MPWQLSRETGRGERGATANSQSSSAFPSLLLSNPYVIPHINDSGNAFYCIHNCPPLSSALRGSVNKGSASVDAHGYSRRLAGESGVCADGIYNSLRAVTIGIAGRLNLDIKRIDGDRSARNNCSLRRG